LICSIICFANTQSIDCCCIKCLGCIFYFKISYCYFFGLHKKKVNTLYLIFFVCATWALFTKILDTINGHLNMFFYASLCISILSIKTCFEVAWKAYYGGTYLKKK
jgi:hypothetical protein